MGDLGGSLPFRQSYNHEAASYPVNASYSRFFEIYFLAWARAAQNDKKRPAGGRPTGRSGIFLAAYLHSIIHIRGRNIPAEGQGFF